MIINVIHLESHKERVENIINLSTIFNGVKVVPGIVPQWETDLSPRSVRGCALSHLNCLYNLNTDEPLLVLEDDALPRMDIWDNTWKSILTSNIPDDCGILIVGSEICNNYIDNDNYFVQVLSPFYGSHAIIYNTKVLRERNFLTHAYKIIASNQMGDSDSQHGICYESVMMQALERCRLSAYRPKNFPFTTMENFSTRDNMVIQPNKTSLDIK